MTAIALFKGGIKSIQRGTATLDTTPANGTTVSVTISAVDPDKAVLICSHAATFEPTSIAATTLHIAASLVRGEIVDATTIAFNRASRNTLSLTINWQVVEYA